MNYYYILSGVTLGPVDADTLHDMARQGIIHPDTPAIAEGQEQWGTYGSLVPAAAAPAPGYTPPPLAPSGCKPPVTYRTRAISGLVRFFSSGAFSGFSPQTQISSISFNGSRVDIEWRDGKTCSLEQGMFTAKAGAYSGLSADICILNRDGSKYRICGCDAELSFDAWLDIKARLGVD